jgi:hypothetical protein
VTVIALSALAGALVSQVVLTGSRAAAQTASSGKEGSVFALAGQLTRDNYGIFLVDSASGTMAIYEWVPDRAQGRKLHLVAARNFTFDLQLDDYNNSEPLPRDVQALVKQQRKLGSGAASQP